MLEPVTTIPGFGGTTSCVHSSAIHYFVLLAWPTPAEPRGPSRGERNRRNPKGDGRKGTGQKMSSQIVVTFYDDL